MKKIALLAIMILSLTGCATAGQPVQKQAPSTKTEQVSNEQLVKNIQAQIAEYNAPISSAKKALMALPDGKAYLDSLDAYNAAARDLRAKYAKVENAPELKRLVGLVARQNELKRLLEGGK